MKKSEFKEGLSKYLVKRDQHVALTIEQARQLSQYVLLYMQKEQDRYEEATHVWYNSKGDSLAMTFEQFDMCKDALNHEVLDTYGLVARSLEFMENRDG